MIRGEGRREGEGTLLAQRLTQVGRPTNWIDTQMVKGSVQNPVCIKREAPSCV